MASTNPATCADTRSVTHAFFLLGRFRAELDGTQWLRRPSPKLQELITFLLLFRGRPHKRETLAGVLWPDSTATQSRAYLRHCLWQLNQSLPDSPPVWLTVDAEWIEAAESTCWLDVGECEAVYDRIRKVPHQMWGHSDVEMLQRATSLYGGDLLEGHYQDWCVAERNRLRRIYIYLLEKLLACHEVAKDIDEGLALGELLLREEPAHEQAHRSLMRLHYNRGNRTAALRQFEQCAHALQQEFDIAPSNCTLQLLNQIRNDHTNVGTDEEEWLGIQHIALVR